MPLLLNSNFIDGEYKKSFSGECSTKSPFYDYSFELPNSSVVDVKLALSYATQARKIAHTLSFEQRAAIVMKAAASYQVTDEECEHLVKMTGMPRKHVHTRMSFGKHILESLPQMIRSRYGHAFGTITRQILKNGHYAGYETHRSVDGVIAAFVPPNDPAELPFLLGHVVMYGGTIIVKPSISEPYMALKIAELLTKAGYPAGGLQVLQWNTADATRAQVSQELVRASSHRIIMGGHHTAEQLLKVHDNDGNITEEHYSSGRNCIFSSGNSKAIMAPGCDIEAVADMLVAGAYEWTRDCVSTKSVFVVGEEQKNKLIAALQRRLTSFCVGDPLDENTDIGFVEDVQKISGIIKGLVDFKYAQMHAGDYNARPFLLETTNVHSPLLQQELPYTLTIFPVDSVSSAVAAINEASLLLEDKMTMAVSFFSPTHIDSLDKSVMNMLLTLRCHLLMYNKPSIALNVFLRHQDTILTEFLTRPMSVNVE